METHWAKFFWTTENEQEQSQREDAAAVQALEIHPQQLNSLFSSQEPLHTLPTVLRPRHKHSQHRRCRNHTYFCILNLRRKFTRKKHTSSHLGVVLQQVRLCVTSLAMEEAGQRASGLKEQWFFYKTKSIHFPQQHWQTPLQTAPSEDFWAQCHNSSWATVTSGTWRRPQSRCFQPELCNFRAVLPLGKQLQVQDIFNFYNGAQHFQTCQERELLISCTWW